MTADPRTPDARRAHFPLWISLAGVAFLAPLFAVAARFMEFARFESEANHVELHFLGDRLAADIDAWRSKHGRYPVSLGEAKLISPLTTLAGFRYEPETEGFVLNFGVPDGLHMRHTLYHRGARRQGYAGRGWDCAD